MAKVSSCFSILLFSWIPTVSSHAYIWYPPSRNLIGSRHVPHCFNSKQYTTGIATQHKYTGSGGYVAKDDDFSKGYCGTFGGIQPDDVETEEAQIMEFQAGTKIPFVIVYNAQHGGQMDFRVCTRGIRHSQNGEKKMDHIEGSKCFDEHLLKRTCVEDCGCDSDQCKELPKYKGMTSGSSIFKGKDGSSRDKTGFGVVSMQHGAQEVLVDWPKNLGCSGGKTGDVCTVQWFWTTAWGEQFWNCIDIRIKGAGGGGSAPTPVSNPVPNPVPNPMPKPVSGGGAIGKKEGYWTSDGATVKFTEQNRKPGRVCWDFQVAGGKSTNVYYQTMGDIYHSWTQGNCCMKAAPQYGGAGTQANVYAFEGVTGGGFCECLGWNPQTGGTKCAGQASTANMFCRVNGGQSTNHKECKTTEEGFTKRPASLGGPVGSGGGGSEEEPEPEPEEEPEEEGAKDCEHWCDLPPVAWDRKCKWQVCGACNECGASAIETYYAAKSCTSGDTAVTSKAVCQAAAKKLGYSWSSTNTGSVCTVHKKSAKVKWQGPGSKWNRKLCLQSSLLQVNANSTHQSRRTKFSQHVALEVSPVGEILDA